LPLFVLIVWMFLTATIASGQAPQKKNVLIITEVGLSHALTNLMMQQILTGVKETPDRHVEFYSESLDLISMPERPTPQDIREWLVKKYGGQKIDVVVAMGPNVVRFLGNQTQSMLLDVPIVICGGAADQAGNPTLDSRFTGTWVKREAAKTLEAALQIFPDTRHVAVVMGTSSYDKLAGALTKADIRSFESRLDIMYFSEFEMSKMLEQLQHLPKQSIVLYVSFFQDAAGNKFVNATKALPMVAAAANAPVFGMSDTYLGHGIVGGDVMAFENQGKVTARVVSELLDGKRAEDIPIETLPSVYMFDWNELQRWHIRGKSLPTGSIVVFREPDLWERTRWMWIAAFLIVLGLSALVVYLQHSRAQLTLAKEKQAQLTGMLISSGEKERSRVASELHDDFSQRIALLALGLENAAEVIPSSPEEANRQLHALSNSASELGADLHTLSHRLHSTTLERLGLVTGVSALCKEFQAQKGVQVEFTHNEIPQAVHPDVALCIFRIIQEGLRNVSKHGGVHAAQVGVHIVANKLRVFVADKGAGFDLRKLEKEDGLGILSMKERARFIGGNLEIQTEPGQGTRLEAWVPLEPPSRAGTS
jgi:signal transduction histidine kinase